MKKNDKFHFVTMDNLEEEKKQAILNRRVADNKEEKEEMPSNKKNYFSYKKRLITYITAMSILFVVAIFLTINIIINYKNDIIEYKETSNISYKVCYSDNDCKNEFGNYDSEKTSTIPIHYTYQIDYSKDYQDTISYYIKAILRIYDKNSGSILEKKEEILLDKTEPLLNKRIGKIDANVEVNYKNYDEIVKNYEKAHLNEKINAELEVFLFQDEKTKSRNVSSLVIPMSSTTYKITKNVLIDDTGKVKMTSEFWTTSTTIKVGIAFISLSFGIVILYEMIKFIQKTANKKNDYNKKLLKLLREYDRIIVIARDGYESNLERETIKVESFDELLEIKQVLQKPIIYSRVNDVKSEFIVEGEDKLYKFIMKEADV